MKETLSTPKLSENLKPDDRKRVSGPISARFVGGRNPLTFAFEGVCAEVAEPAHKVASFPSEKIA
jgi:hypothetical protein